jgi:hypothetical protein
MREIEKEIWIQNSQAYTQSSQKKNWFACVCWSWFAKFAEKRFGEVLTDEFWKVLDSALFVVFLCLWRRKKRLRFWHETRTFAFQTQSPQSLLCAL